MDSKQRPGEEVGHGREEEEVEKRESANTRLLGSRGGGSGKAEEGKEEENTTTVEGTRVGDVQRGEDPPPRGSGLHAPVPSDDLCSSGVLPGFFSSSSSGFPSCRGASLLLQPSLFRGDIAREEAAPALCPGHSEPAPQPSSRPGEVFSCSLSSDALHLPPRSRATSAGNAAGQSSDGENEDETEEETEGSAEEEEDEDEEEDGDERCFFFRGRHATPPESVLLKKRVSRLRRRLQLATEQEREGRDEEEAAAAEPWTRYILEGAQEGGALGGGVDQNSRGGGEGEEESLTGRQAQASAERLFVRDSEGKGQTCGRAEDAAKEVSEQFCEPQKRRRATGSDSAAGVREKEPVEDGRREEAEVLAGIPRLKRERSRAEEGGGAEKQEEQGGTWTEDPEEGAKQVDPPAFEEGKGLREADEEEEDESYKEESGAEDTSDSSSSEDEDGEEEEEDFDEDELADLLRDATSDEFFFSSTSSSSKRRRGL